MGVGVDPGLLQQLRIPGLHQLGVQPRQLLACGRDPRPHGLLLAEGHGKLLLGLLTALRPRHLIQAAHLRHQRVRAGQLDLEILHAPTRTEHRHRDPHSGEPSCRDRFPATPTSSSGGLQALLLGCLS